jgi:hypothetical protein
MKKEGATHVCVSITSGGCWDHLLRRNEPHRQDTGDCPLEEMSGSILLLPTHTESGEVLSTLRPPFSMF